jgi:hypothetical protein
MTEQIYKEHKDAQVWTFGYDASTNRSGIATRSGIREKAFELLEALLVMRKQWESVCAGLYHETQSPSRREQADEVQLSRNQFQ